MIFVDTLRHILLRRYSLFAFTFIKKKEVKKYKIQCHENYIPVTFA